MKKLVLALSFLMIFFSNNSFAEPLPRRTFSFGPEVYSYVYKESSINVELKGIKYGLTGAAAFHVNRFLYAGELSGAIGDVDYSSGSTGSVDNVQDISWEGRFLFGYDWIDEEDRLFTAYTGFGYRHLDNNMGGTRSTTGAFGYDRESNYYYLPIGIQGAQQYENGWRIMATVEADILLTGNQKSNFSDVSRLFRDVSTDQNKGYGFRGSLKFLKKGTWVDFSLEPFVRYWHIETSEESAIVFSNTIIGLGVEPDNTTTELGINCALNF